MPKTEEILVPDLGDFDKVEVTEVLIEVDQNITSNENIITVETDKASIDVPSDKTGKIHSVKVKVGDYIKKGSLILTIETGAKSSSDNKKSKVNKALKDKVTSKCSSVAFRSQN